MNIDITNNRISLQFLPHNKSPIVTENCKNGYPFYQSVIVTNTVMKFEYNDFIYYFNNA